MSRLQIVSTKGQVVIPADFREFLGIIPSQKVLLSLDRTKKQIILQPVGNVIEDLCGTLSGKGKSAATIKRQVRAEESSYENKKIKRFRS